MNHKRKFGLATVLSVISGIVLSHDWKELLNFMVGEDVDGTSLIIAQERCHESLLKQFPSLGLIDFDGLTNENVDEFMKEWEILCGSQFEVSPLFTSFQR